MGEHKELALITLGIFAVLAVWRLIRERKMGGGERAAALVLGLIGLGFLVATAREGGEMMFEHAAGVPTATLQSEIMNRAEGHHHHPGEADDDHDHDHGDAEADSAAAPHTHAPGTPPHQD